MGGRLTLHQREKSLGSTRHARTRRHFRHLTNEASRREAPEGGGPRVFGDKFLSRPQQPAAPQTPQRPLYNNPPCPVCLHPDPGPLEQHLRSYHNKADMLHTLKANLSRKLEPEHEWRIRVLANNGNSAQVARLLSRFLETRVLDFAALRALA